MEAGKATGAMSYVSHHSRNRSSETDSLSDYNRLLFVLFVCITVLRCTGYSPVSQLKILNNHILNS